MLGGYLYRAGIGFGLPVPMISLLYSARGEYLRSSPALNIFGNADDRTTARMSESWCVESASNVRPYSFQKLWWCDVSGNGTVERPLTPW